MSDIKASHIRAALRQRFDQREFALFNEVIEPDSWTRADAIAVGLWRSHGHEVHGFEIKVSRSDWLTEMRKASKSDPMMRHCTRWWLAVPKGLVTKDEVPDSWGILELMPSGQLRSARRAPKLEAHPLDRAFMANVLRRAQQQTEAVVNERVQAELVTARATMEQTIKNEAARRAGDRNNYKQLYDELVEALGMDWGTTPDGVRKAVRVVTRLGVFKTHNQLDGLLNTLRSVERQLTTELTALREAAKPISSGGAPGDSEGTHDNAAT